MKTPYILGLTGGLASGKSTVAGFFVELGATIVDADAIVHNLQKPDTPQTKAIADHLGAGVLNADGSLNRQVLGQKVLADQSVLAFLESILHPAVYQEEKKQIQKAAQRGAPLVVLDVPLLFEVGAHKKCDSTLLCHSPLEVRKARALKRPGMTKDKWDTLLKRRLPDDQALKLADFTLATGAELEQTQQEVHALYKKLLAKQAQAYRAHWAD